MKPPEKTAAQIVEQFDAVLLDSYGVLVDGSGALPGARRFLERLDETHTPWLVVSNDASRSLEAAAVRYEALDLPIPADRILVSAALIAPYFAREQLGGSRCIVLGPVDSVGWVEQAGGVVVPYDDRSPDVVVACDDEGYPFVEAVEAVISTLVARIREGVTPRLVLPNPDRIYPAGDGRLRLTAGSTALVIESALAAVFGPDAPRFVGLGKPHAFIFEEACHRIGTSGRRVAMLGDQILTDVAGAKHAGLSAGLVATGIATAGHGELQPDFIVRSLR